MENISNNAEGKVMHPDGLNFVPRLTAQNTPPVSSRTRMSISSRRSLTRYGELFSGNGNYEGDCSMFKHPPFRDTDSETEYRKELTFFAMAGSQYMPESPLRQLWLDNKHRLISEAHLKKLITYKKRLQRNRYYKKFCTLLVMVCMVLFWVLSLLLKTVRRFSILSYELARINIMLRSAARCMLWWMTTTKGDNLSLFFTIVIVAPPLFVISVFGLVISVYCTIEQVLSNAVNFIRDYILYS